MIVGFALSKRFSQPQVAVPEHADYFSFQSSSSDIFSSDESLLRAILF